MPILLLLYNSPTISFGTTGGLNSDVGQNLSTTRAQGTVMYTWKLIVARCEKTARKAPRRHIHRLHLGGRLAVGSATGLVVVDIVILEIIGVFVSVAIVRTIW